MAIEELWRDVPGYEGIYQASNLGRIRIAPDKVTANSRYPERHWRCRILKPKATYTKRQDERVTLWKDGAPRDYLVARLIAMTWCKGFSEDLTINHIDGDCRNNSANNLECVTLADNIRHGFNTGLYKSIQKPVALLTEDEAILKFASMAEASRFLGHKNGYLSAAILKRRKIYDLDGHTYTLSGG